MIRAAENVYLIADSTKIGDTSFANLGRISLVDALICDSNLPEDVKSKLKDMNVKIISLAIYFSWPVFQPFFWQVLPARFHRRPLT